jgi:hypothetical protein
MQSHECRKLGFIVYDPLWCAQFRCFLHCDARFICYYGQKARFSLSSSVRVFSCRPLAKRVAALCLSQERRKDQMFETVQGNRIALRLRLKYCPLQRGNQEAGEFVAVVLP